MTIIQVVIPDHDIDIPLAELMGLVRERLEYGPMDGFNRLFAHIEVKVARPRPASAKQTRNAGRLATS
jgi:hypothetical protein